MSLTRRGFLRTGLGAACAAPVLARPARANDWDALRRPGAVALMRHALAPGTGDPAGFEIGDCRTQRNLSAAGEAQAAAIGAELRARGLAFDRVLTSQWCRARDTARLLQVGPVEEAPAFNSFFADRGARGAQTDAALALLRQAQGRVLAVTHQVNITALTGRAASSGEIIVARPDGQGMAVLGSVLLAP